MKVLIDTPIWSYALRSRKKEYQSEIEQLESLIKDQRALIIGLIRQEVLSGYSDFKKFITLKEMPRFKIPIMNLPPNCVINVEKKEFRVLILIFSYVLLRLDWRSPYSQQIKTSCSTRRPFH